MRNSHSPRGSDGLWLHRYLGTGLAVVGQQPDVSSRHVVSLANDGGHHAQVESCSRSTVPPRLGVPLGPGSADRLPVRGEAVQTAHWRAGKQGEQQLSWPELRRCHSPPAPRSPAARRLHLRAARGAAAPARAPHSRGGLPRSPRRHPLCSAAPPAPRGAPHGRAFHPGSSCTRRQAAPGLCAEQPRPSAPAGKPWMLPVRITERSASERMVQAIQCPAMTGTSSQLRVLTAPSSPAWVSPGMGHAHPTHRSSCGGSRGHGCRPCHTVLWGSETHNAEPPPQPRQPELRAPPLPRGTYRSQRARPAPRGRRRAAGSARGCAGPSRTGGTRRRAGGARPCCNTGTGTRPESHHGDTVSAARRRARPRPCLPQPRTPLLPARSGRSCASQQRG